MERFIAVWMMLFGFGITVVYFMAWVNPERNSLTRFIERYLSRRYGGLRVLTARQSMILIALGGAIVGLLGIYFFFQRGWWSF